VDRGPGRPRNGSLGSPAEALGLTSQAIGLIRDLVHERLGLFYGPDRLDQFAERLAPLVVQRGFGAFLDYYYLLKYDPAGEAEWERVIDALAVSETFFWREIDQIRAIVDEVVPQLVAARRGASLEIWSVPCATGEEPLTIAMVLEDAGWFARAPIRIIGSDASPAAVARARAGVFRERSFRNLPERLRERYFRRTGEGWQVDEALHRRVTWDVVNLMAADQVARWAAAPVVFCRNLFIYFSETSIRRGVGLLAALMPLPGYLCLGASESLLRITDAFELQEIGGAFVYVLRPGGKHRRSAALAACERA
jgi:chemotaxis protein methyltransferase CheR